MRFKISKKPFNFFDATVVTVKFTSFSAIVAI